MLGIVGIFEIRRSTLPPSGLPAISPSRGEIVPAAFAGSCSATLAIGADKDEGVISPLVGEMAGRPEGGATGRKLEPQALGSAA
jgi:peptide/nickel transport system ATP-binding protein